MSPRQKGRRGTRRGGRVRESTPPRYSSSEAPTLLFDVNVLLDVILRREPWWIDSARALDLAARGKVRAVVAAHSVTTIHYLVARAQGAAAARTAVAGLISIVTIAPVGHAQIARALELDLRDFEDAVQAAAAEGMDATVIVTRNPRDFEDALQAVLSPAQLLETVR